MMKVISPHINIGLSRLEANPQSNHPSASPTLDFAYATGAGRKHYYRQGSLQVNEDGHGTFELKFGNHHAIALWVADGHGEVVQVPTTEQRLKEWNGTGAQRYVALLTQVLPETVEKLFQDALDMDKDVESAILHQLTHLHTRLNDAVNKFDSVLASENGATLSLIVYCPGFGSLGTVFACNIGDSSILMCNPATGTPLKVWKRVGVETDELQVCSFEDTLASFPDAIKQGQTFESVKKDHQEMISKTRCMTNARGLNYYAVQSTKSLYGLSMINTLGNMNHFGQLQSRTNVYSLNLEQIFEEGMEEVVIYLCTDGIKDVLSAEDISAMSGNVAKGLKSLAGDVPDAQILGQIVSKRGVGSLVPMSEELREKLTMSDIPPTDRFDSRAKETLQNLINFPPSLATFCDATMALATLRKSGDDCTALAFGLPLKRLQKISSKPSQTASLSQVSNPVLSQGNLVVSQEVEEEMVSSLEEIPIPSGSVAPPNSQQSLVDPFDVKTLDAVKTTLEAQSSLQPSQPESEKENLPLESQDQAPSQSSTGSYETEFFEHDLPMSQPFPDASPLASQLTTEEHSEDERPTKRVRRD